MEEAALLFGGNVGLSVAGNWQVTDGLMLASVADEAASDGGLTVTVKSFGGAAERGAQTLWPVARWGATLTSIGGEGHVLVGGWHSDWEEPITWTLHLREAGPEWVARSGSPSTLQGGDFDGLSFAFATATTLAHLPGGNAFCHVGGLSQGTCRSLCYYDGRQGSWSLRSTEGPGLAGHAAGCSEQGRVVVFGGIERRTAGVFAGFRDGFHQTVHIWDARADRWDEETSITSLDGAGPLPRRQLAFATLGDQLVISGGWSDRTRGSLIDSWAFDMVRDEWAILRTTPGSLSSDLYSSTAVGGARQAWGEDSDLLCLSAHKAIVTGCDLLTFGGHKAPGEYVGASMDVRALRLGAGGSNMREEPSLKKPRTDQKDLQISTLSAQEASQA